MLVMRLACVARRSQYREQIACSESSPPIDDQRLCLILTTYAALPVSLLTSVLMTKAFNSTILSPRKRQTSQYE